MEDLIRKVVKEEFGLLRKNLMDKIQSNQNRQGSTSERSLHLKFLEKISCSVLTGTKIKGEAGTSIKLALVDSRTGEVVKTGAEAAAEVQILVLDGHNGGGALEEFNNRIVSEIKGKKSILRGTTTLNLQEGISSIDHLSFTQNSNWMRNRELCLGARALTSFSGTTIEPAKTEPFILKDRRSRLYAKNEIPSLLDELWRLKHIDKNGARIKRLKDENIQNVKDLLELLNKNPQKLRKILKVGSKTWEEITDHARTCIIDACDRSVDARQYSDENSLREHFARTSESTRQQSPDQSYIQPGTASHGIGESCQLGALEEGVYFQVYCPDSMLPLPDEFFKFINDSDPSEMLSPELGPKITWTYVICVLKWFMIRKRVGSSERDHVNKKQKILTCAEKNAQMTAAQY